MPKKFKLPLNPKTVSRDNCVFVCFEDGSEIFWSEEESYINALDVARELEIELRVVSYLKNRIKDFVEGMVELLYSIDADEGLLVSIINDGHNFAFKEISSQISRKLRLDEKPEIKHLIIEKLDAQYVV